MNMNKLEGIAARALEYVRLHGNAKRVVIIAEKSFLDRWEARATVIDHDGGEVAVTLTAPPEEGDSDAPPF